MLRTHMLRLRPTHVFLTHIYTRRSPGPRRQYVYCTMRPFFSLFVCKFYFPAQLIGGFSLSDLLDKPWSQVTSHLPPGTCLQFLSRIGFSIRTARRFHRMLLTHALALSANQFFARKSPYEYVNSVRIELAKLI